MRIVGKRTARRVIAGWIAVFLMAGGASAAQAGTLDEDTSPALETCQALGSLNGLNYSLAQTFTAGVTGQLDQVDLALFNISGSAPVTVEIRDVVGGQPGATVLASGSIPAAQIGPTVAFIPVALPAPTPVVAETQYAIVAYTSAGVLHGWCRAQDPYAGGSGFFSETAPPTTWAGLSPDLAFKTYVATQCSDELDNDGDDRTDLQDLGCSSPTDNDESTSPAVCQFNPGTPGNDTFIGGGGPDRYNGEGGDDFIAGQGGADCLSGDTGGDVIIGGAGTDVLDGGPGGDRLEGEGGADQIYGGGGGDHIEGGDGADAINPEAGADTVLAGPGNDRVVARDGTRDVIDCGAGNADVALVDPFDKVTNCETVEVAP